MGLFDFFKAKNEAPKVQETQFKDRKAKEITSKVIKQQLYRFNQELSNWKNAIYEAEDVYNPRLVELIRVYNDMVIDAHLQAALTTRKNKVLSQDYKIVDSEGEEVREQTELFESAWFRDTLNHVLDSKFFGHSLIQFQDRKGRTFEGVKLVPREYVYPQKKAVRRTPYQTSDIIPYDSGIYNKWTIESGAWSMGLLMNAAPLVIFKKTALGAWTEFTELFGSPFRLGKTTIRDEELRENMYSMLENMGRNAFGVFDKDDTLEFIRDNKTDSFNVFNELIERANSEISKLILGTTMLMDDSSSRSQAEVHERTTQAIIKNDSIYITEWVNYELIPWLNKHHGFNITGKWVFDDTEDLGKEGQFKIDLELLKSGKFKIPAEYFIKTYGTPVEEIEKKEATISPNPTNPDELENSLKKKTSLATIYEGFIAQSSCDVCNTIDASDVPPQEWDEDFIEDIVRGVYAGKYTIEQLPELLYKELGSRLMDGAWEGVKEVNGLAVIDDPRFFQSLTNNAYVFSGAKTFQQVKEMSDFLLDESGNLRKWAEYKAKADEIFKTYNENWLRTEIAQATNAAQMASKWQEIENDKDILPFLKYNTQGDERVREDHKRLDGVIKAVDSPFWDTYYPPNGWNCRCNILQIDEAVETIDEDIETPDVPDYMKVNVGKQRLLFSPEHPYFVVDDQYSKLRDNNFNLSDPPDYRETI